MAQKHVVCRLEDLPPGERTIVEIDRRSIGVFNVDGNLYALRNRCPHRGAPLCKGILTDLITSSDVYCFEIEREGEILRCPWHGWEFDVVTGESIFNPHRVKVRSYDVTVEQTIGDPSIETFPVSVEEEFVVLHTGV